MRRGGDATVTVKETDLSLVRVTLGGNETIMAGSHLCEGVRDEIRFRKVIGVAEDVGERVRVDCKEARSIEKATVGKGMAVLLYPRVKDMVVLLVC
jgi:hypothetical protein